MKKLLFVLLTAMVFACGDGSKRSADEGGDAKTEENPSGTTDETVAPADTTVTDTTGTDTTPR